MIELLYAALSSEYGIIVATEDVERLRQKLYRLRKESDSFDILSFVVSPTNPNGELWILKRKEANHAED